MPEGFLTIFRSFLCTALEELSVPSSIPLLLLFHKKLEEQRTLLPCSEKARVFGCISVFLYLGHLASLVRLSCVYEALNRVWLFATPWTVAYQAPLSMEFFRQEYWSELSCPSPGDRPNPGIEPRSPTCRRILYHLNHRGPYSQAIVQPLPQMHLFSQCPRDSSICCPAPSKLNLWFPRGDKQGLVPFPPPWGLYHGDLLLKTLIRLFGLFLLKKNVQEFVNSFVPTGSTLSIQPIFMLHLMFILAELFLTTSSSICHIPSKIWGWLVVLWPLGFFNSSHELRVWPPFFFFF